MRRKTPSWVLPALCMCWGAPLVGQDGRVVVTANSAVAGEFRQQATFVLTEEAPAHTVSFVPLVSERVTVGVQCEGHAVLVLALDCEGAPRLQGKGEGQVGLSVGLQRGKPCTVTVELEDPAGGPVSGSLAIMAGTAEAPRRLLPSSQIPGFAAAPIPEGRRDLLVPLFVRLAERHLTGASDRNELDVRFAEMLKTHPRLTRERLSRMVADYRGMPEDERAARFVEITPGKPELSPISRWDLQQALGAASPEAAEALRTASEEVAGAGQAALASINHLEPESLGEGYAAGTKVILRGCGFPAGEDTLRVELWPPDPRAGKPSHRLKPTGASHDTLTFALPGQLEAGLWTVRLATGSSRSNGVSLSIGGGKSAPGAAMAVTSAARFAENGAQYLYLRGSGFAGDGTSVQLTFMYPQRDALTVTLPADVLEDELMRIGLAEKYMQDVTGIRVEAFRDCYPHTFPVYYVYNDETPRYRVKYTTMHCYDESSPETWMGINCSDTLVTIWSVIADGDCHVKNSRSYNDFDDGDEGDYWPCDWWVVPHNGYERFQPVRDGIVVCTRIYEWDEGDLETATEVVDGIGRICSMAVDLIFPGTGAGYVVTAISQIIQLGMDCWFGYWSRPDPMGECVEVFTTEDLAAQFNGARSKTGGAVGGGVSYNGYMDSLDDSWLDHLDDEVHSMGVWDTVYRQIDFINDDDTGSYALRYELQYQTAPPLEAAAAPTQH